MWICVIRSCTENLIRVEKVDTKVCITTFLRTLLAFFSFSQFLRKLQVHLTSTPSHDLPCRHPHLSPAPIGKMRKHTTARFSRAWQDRVFRLKEDQVEICYPNNNSAIDSIPLRMLTEAKHSAEKEYTMMLAFPGEVHRIDVCDNLLKSCLRCGVVCTCELKVLLGWLCSRRAEMVRSDTTRTAILHRTFLDSHRGMTTMPSTNKHLLTHLTIVNNHAPSGGRVVVSCRRRS